MKHILSFLEKQIIPILLLFLILTCSSNVEAQTLLSRWGGVLQQTCNTTYPISSNYQLPNQGLTGTENYSGLQTDCDNRHYYRTLNAATTLNVATAPYLEYTINLSSIKKIDFDRFVIYGFYHTDGKAQLRWSVDNYATSLGEFSTANAYNLTSRNLNSLPDFIGTTVSFRIYFYAAVGSLVWNGQPLGRTIAVTSGVASGNLPNTSYDGTPSTYWSAWQRVGIYVNSIVTPVQNINIVSSGGAAEGSGWSYSNGVISPNTLYDVSINASDIATKLSQGNLSVETNNASITISASITSSSANALTFKAAGNILQNSGAKVSTNVGNITYWSDSDDNGQGAIVVGTSSANGGEEIISNGGNITLSGGQDVTTGYAKAAVGFLPWAAKPYGGVSIFHANIDAKGANNTGGNVTIRGSISNSL
ncbi:MAG: hypothetical protein ACOVOV_18620, partial [Dolichospermum sp.]